GKELGACDLLVFGTEGVEEREALIDRGAASPALAPQAYVRHVASVAPREDLENVEAEPAPDLPELVPIATHVLVPAQGCGVDKDGGDVKDRVLRVHGLHAIELASVPALEPLGELIEDFGGDRLGDVPSLLRRTVSRKRAPAQQPRASRCRSSTSAPGSGSSRFRSRPRFAVASCRRRSQSPRGPC